MGLKEMRGEIINQLESRWNLPYGHKTSVVCFENDRPEVESEIADIAESKNLNAEMSYHGPILHIVFTAKLEEQVIN